MYTHTGCSNNLLSFHHLLHMRIRTGCFSNVLNENKVKPEHYTVVLYVQKFCSY